MGNGKRESGQRLRDIASLHVQGIVWEMGRLEMTAESLNWKTFLPWFSQLTRRVMRIPIPDSVTVQLNQVTGCGLGKRGERTMLPELQIKRPLVVHLEDRAYLWNIGAYWWTDPSKRWLTLLQERLAELAERDQRNDRER